MSDIKSVVSSAVSDTQRAVRNIAIPHNQIAEFCQRWKVTEFALFGSVLRDDFRPDSDIDVLVSFAPDAQWSLFDLVEMQEEIKHIFGREVDLVERNALHNPFIRSEILKSLEYPMRPAEPDLAYLWDIREAAHRLMRHTQGAIWEQLQTDEMLQDAVARPLEVIGEAARHISQETKAAHPEIPWIKMIGLRNVLIHEYFRVNLERIWAIIQNDVPTLIKNIEPLIPSEDV